jgi:phosphonate transport system substrate-binding protein
MTALKRFTLFALIALAGRANAQAGLPQTVYLGSVAMEIPAEMVRRMAPLASYLSRQTGINVSFRASPNMNAAVAELGTGVTGLAYMTPVAYVDARRKYQVQALVAPLTHGKSSFRLVLAVKQGSAIRSAADLKGKTFALGDEKALLQQAVVVGAGVELAEFSSYAFLKHYDNIAKAVLNDDFDAGILTEAVFLDFAPRGLRSVHTSPPLPSYVFAVNAKLPPATVEKLRGAFLALRADVPEHRDILQQLGKGYDGFAPARDADYDIVRELIAPFVNR